MKKRPIDYRDARLVVALVGALYEAEAPIPEAELMATFGAGRWTPDTVRRTLRELYDFGALRRVTPLRLPAGYRMTPLGRAWADGRLERYVVEREDDDPDG